MPAAVVPAAFQDVGEALDVGVDIGVRILQRIADAGLRREMHHVGKLLGGKQSGNACAIGEIELEEAEVRVTLELLEPRLLQRRIVVGVHAVEADHAAARFKQAARHVRADEARSARHQHRFAAHSRHSSIPSGLVARSSIQRTSNTSPAPPRNSRRTSAQPSRA